MIGAFHIAGFAAALLSPASIQDGAQPTQAELEAALLAHDIRIVSYPLPCRDGPVRGCLKPAKAMRVRNYDCQARGADAKGAPILFCRVSYIQKGGALANVRWRDKCVPLRARAVETDDGTGTRLIWEVALIDAVGRCPGGRI